jgi:hypothetical protein
MTGRTQDADEADLRYEAGASRRGGRIDLGAVAAVAERLQGRGKQSIRSGSVGAADRPSALE